MDKQLLVEKIRKVDSKQSLLDLLNEIKAELLGCKSYPFTMRKMMKLCNPKLESNRYRQFTIPKKSGGLRDIYAPNGNLKWMQICLNEIFKAVYAPSPYAMGFVEGRCIVDNARIHTNQNYVFNIDLADFFPSIDQARVWKRLQLPPFNFNKEVANVVAGLCSIKSLRATSEEAFSECYNLPQGAPTSPLLTNAICDKLDRRLAGLAKRFNLHYSRYADDITFSSMHNVYQEDSEFRKELERIIKDQQFQINPKKTRLNHRSRRQEVTGLTVSEKVNVTRKYVKDIRAILHIWERYGANAALSAFYPRYKAERGYLLKGEPNIENVISGKLCYLKMVKGENYPQYIKLSEQFARLTSNQKPILKERSWEYLQSEAIADFEKRLGVTIQYAKSNKGKAYAFFELGGQRILASVSQNISIRHIPKDAQISLCLQTDFKIRFGGEFYISHNQLEHADDNTVIGRMKMDCPLPEDLGQRFFYLIHRPLKPDAQKRIIVKDKNAEMLKKAVIEIAQQFPSELGLRDAFGIIESSMGQSKDTLTRLIESNFDLSILP
ncbi:MAG: RNA-directed DNA polymerase [Duncaniella sp.]|nr:RNA-directed DNA polymerase [Duncaniella sp.]